MSRIRERPDGKLFVGTLGAGKAGKARAAVVLEEAEKESSAGPFLCSRDFEIGQANCPWVGSLRAYVESNGKTLPAKREDAEWARVNQGTSGYRGVCCSAAPSVPQGKEGSPALCKPYWCPSL
jgi:hypothetical protein